LRHFTDLVMNPVTIPFAILSAALIAAAAASPPPSTPSPASLSGSHAAAAPTAGALSALLGAPSRYATPGPVRADSPVSVRLMLDRERYVPGATGQVRVAIGRDGYLLVLYSDPTGHVRVAFPLDPDDSATVRKDTILQVRSRGDRDAFLVDDSTGVGTWYAAISSQPFFVDSISVAHHWDYRAIPRVRDPESAEHELTDFVERIQPARFEYDIVSFTIGVDSIARTSDADGPWFIPTGPFYPGPWSANGPWAPGPWWSQPHWPGPYLDRVVEGSAGTATAVASASAARLGPGHPRSISPGDGGPSNDKGGKAH
jgi:hypothetical protein